MPTASGGWLGSELPAHGLGGVEARASGCPVPADLPRRPGVQSWPDPLVSPLSSWPCQGDGPGPRSPSPPASWLLALRLASSGCPVTASTGQIPVRTARWRLCPCLPVGPCPRVDAHVCVCLRSVWVLFVDARVSSGTGFHAGRLASSFCHEYTHADTQKPKNTQKHGLYSKRTDALRKIGT